MDTKKLRQKILDLAIRGKLVPQDPNDEPASVLLDRIRAEKERLIAEGKIKRSKKSKTSDASHYQNFEPPFEIPDSWEWVRLEDICHIKGGKRIPQGKTFSKSITPHVYIRVTDMKENTIRLNNLKYIDEEVYAQIKNYTISKDDLYLTIAGTIGVVGQVPDELDGMNLTENAAKLTQILIDKKFLMYQLISSHSQEHFVSRFHQVAQPKLSIETASSTLLAIPPLSEQVRISQLIEQYLNIVTFLENEIKSVEDDICLAKSKILNLAISGKLVPQESSNEPAIEALRRINPSFQPCDNPQYQHKIISLPNTWCCATFDSINTYKSASVNPASNPNEIYELYSVPTFETGMPEFIIGNQIASTKALVKSRDVLLCKINPHLNRAWVVSHHRKDLRCIASSEWIVFRNEALNSSYMQLCLTSPYFKELMMSNVSGVGGSLMRAQPIYVKKYTIPIPPIAEQQRIVDKVNELFIILDSIQNSLDAN